MHEGIRVGWRMTGPGQLTWFEEALPPPPPGHVTIEVVGCGVCHTDLGYLYDGVAPAHKGPLVLGHEIIGRTPDGGLVLVPAVSPCGECAACRRGRPTACASSRMPGNHHDGGFASHVQVPARWLVPVPEVDEPWRLAAIADAVTTPLQAVRRTGLAAGDVAIVVGAGGVGGFLVEIAPRPRRDRGRDRRRAGPARAGARPRGAAAQCRRSELEPRGARRSWPAAARAAAARAPLDAGWHVFECLAGTARGRSSGSGSGTRGGKLAVVQLHRRGRAAAPVHHLMALDAEAYGNWGADAALAGRRALAMVLAGDVDVAGAVGRHALRDAPTSWRASTATSSITARCWCPMAGDDAPAAIDARRPTTARSSSCACAGRRATSSTAPRSTPWPRWPPTRGPGPRRRPRHPPHRRRPQLLGRRLGARARARRAAAMLGQFRRAIRALVACDLPIIAAVRGHCLGGGSRAGAVRHRIVAHPDAQLSQPGSCSGRAGARWRQCSCRASSARPRPRRCWCRRPRRRRGRPRPGAGGAIADEPRRGGGLDPGQPGAAVGALAAPGHRPRAAPGPRSRHAPARARAAVRRGCRPPTTPRRACAPSAASAPALGAPMTTIDAIVSDLEARFDDVALGHVRACRSRQAPRCRLAIGCLPVFAPREVLCSGRGAAVFVRGAGDRAARPSAATPSAVVHLPPAALDPRAGPALGHLDALDG
ncbi:MAG: alcohol dehydrogenase catalytic domain-containing protein [Kofleriaceae bacterium]|nr:alcohol dehydrogenase catalytic domain-containing protein [Kofleriaceae bacterium]